MTESVEWRTVEVIEGLFGDHMYKITITETQEEW